MVTKEDDLKDKVKEKWVEPRPNPVTALGKHDHEKQVRFLCGGRSPSLSGLRSSSAQQQQATRVPYGGEGGGLVLIWIQVMFLPGSNNPQEISAGKR